MSEVQSVDLAAVRDIAGQLKPQAAQFKTNTSGPLASTPAWFPADIGDRIGSDHARTVSAVAELADQVMDIATGLADHALVVDTTDVLPAGQLKVQG